MLMHIQSLQSENNNNDFTIIITGLDWDVKSRLMDILTTISSEKTWYFRNSSGTAEEQPEELPVSDAIGSRYTIKAGVFNGLTVSSGFARFGYGFLAELIKGDCLFGMNYVDALDVRTDCYEYIFIKIANGLMEYDMKKTDVLSSFSFLGSDLSVQKVQEILIERYRRLLEDSEELYNSAVINASTADYPYAAMSVVDAFKQDGLHAIAKLFCGKKEIINYDDVSKYCKRIMKQLFKKVEYINPDEFLSAFQNFFPDFDYSRVKDLSEAEKRIELFTKIDNLKTRMGLQD